MFGPSSGRAFRALSTVSSVPSSPAVGARRRHYRVSLSGSIHYWPADQDSPAIEPAIDHSPQHDHHYSALVRILDRTTQQQPPARAIQCDHTEELRAVDALTRMADFRQRTAAERQLTHMTLAARKRHDQHIDGVGGESEAAEEDESAAAAGRSALASGRGSIGSAGGEQLAGRRK